MDTSQIDDISISALKKWWWQSRRLEYNVGLAIAGLIHFYFTAPLAQCSYQSITNFISR
jgi:hypothetical protein